MKISLYLSVVVIASIISFSAFASEKVDQDDNQLLLASCQSLATTSEQVKARHCAYYILGFVAAAQVIDPIVKKKETEKKRKSFGVMSRPFFNKEKIPPARYFPFCVPKYESESRVIETVSKQLKPDKTDSIIMLRDMIFKALKSEYPCKKG